MNIVKSDDYFVEKETRENVTQTSDKDCARFKARFYIVMLMVAKVGF